MIRDDAIKFYYPKATEKLEQKPFYSHYLTYQEWQAFVTKCSEENRWGYPGHYTPVFEPAENKFVGMISIEYHNSPMEQEYVVSFTPDNIRSQPKWGKRPVQSYFLDDPTEAYALMIAVAYPCMEMWETFQTGGDRDAAIKKCLGMVLEWCDFTEEQIKQFVKNLEVQ